MSDKQMTNPAHWDPDTGCYRRADGTLILAGGACREVVRISPEGHVVIDAGASREALVMALGLALDLCAKMIWEKP